MKKALIILIKSILGFIAFVVIYLLCSFFGTIIPVNNDFKETENGIDIFVISNGVHTDICFPLTDASKNWNNLLNYNSFKSSVNKSGYISCGWGDKGFFLDTPKWSDLTFSTAINAMFLPSSTAMHIAIYNNKPIRNEQTKLIQISESQFQTLENHIFSQFETIESKAQLIDCCRYDGYNDNFYEANGNYSLLKTCNNWANITLKKAGIKTGFWTPFDKCILWQFE